MPHESVILRFLVYLVNYRQPLKNQAKNTPGNGDQLAHKH